MIPRRPYLLRAFYDWLTDNELTPYLMVDTRSEEVIVPREYVEDEQIILNIASSVISDLILGNEEVSFDAYFGGVPFSVVIPMASISAIYAQENGFGTFFEPETFEKKETRREDALNLVQNFLVAEKNQNEKKDTSGFKKKKVSSKVKKTSKSQPPTLKIIK